jgi:hypothetical protein
MAPQNEKGKAADRAEPTSPTALPRTEQGMEYDSIRYSMAEAAAHSSLEKRKKGKPKEPVFVTPTERGTMAAAGKSSSERRKQEGFGKHPTERIADEYAK